MDLLWILFLGCMSVFGVCGGRVQVHVPDRGTANDLTLVWDRNIVDMIREENVEELSKTVFSDRLNTGLDDLGFEMRGNVQTTYTNNKNVFDQYEWMRMCFLRIVEGFRKDQAGKEAVVRDLRTVEFDGNYIAMDFYVMQKIYYDHILGVEDVDVEFGKVVLRALCFIKETIFRRYHSHTTPLINMEYTELRDLLQSELRLGRWFVERSTAGRGRDMNVEANVIEGFYIQCCDYNILSELRRWVNANPSRRRRFLEMLGKGGLDGTFLDDREVSLEERSKFVEIFLNTDGLAVVYPVEVENILWLDCRWERRVNWLYTKYSTLPDEAISRFDGAYGGNVDMQHHNRYYLMLLDYYLYAFSYVATAEEKDIFGPAVRQIVEDIRDEKDRVDGDIGANDWRHNRHGRLAKLKRIYYEYIMEIGGLRKPGEPGTVGDEVDVQDLENLLCYFKEKKFAGLCDEYDTQHSKSGAQVLSYQPLHRKYRRLLWLWSIPRVGVYEDDAGYDTENAIPGELSSRMGVLIVATVFSVWFNWKDSRLGWLERYFSERLKLKLKLQKSPGRTLGIATPLSMLKLFEGLGWINVKDNTPLMRSAFQRVRMVHVVPFVLLLCVYRYVAGEYVRSGMMYQRVAGVGGFLIFSVVVGYVFTVYMPRKGIFWDDMKPDKIGMAWAGAAVGLVVADMVMVMLGMDEKTGGVGGGVEEVWREESAVVKEEAVAEGESVETVVVEEVWWSWIVWAGVVVMLVAAGLVCVWKYA